MLQNLIKYSSSKKYIDNCPKFFPTRDWTLFSRLKIKFTTHTLRICKFLDGLSYCCGKNGQNKYFFKNKNFCIDENETELSSPENLHIRNLRVINFILNKK